MPGDAEAALAPESAPPFPIGGQRAAMAFVWVTAFLSILTYGIIAPTLPRLVLSFFNGDTVRAAEMVGLIGTAFGLMHCLFSVIQGALSDHFGRRPILVSSNLGLGVDYIIMALAPSVWWLFGSRLISGMTGASVMTSYAYVTDITPPERRTRVYGIMGMAGGLGSMAGPALGGVLGDIDVRLPFWVAAAVSLINGLYGYLVVPESLPRALRARLTLKRINPFSAITILRFPGPLRPLLIANLLIQFSGTVIPTVFVLYTGWRYGWTAHDAGLALASLGLGGLVVQGWLLGFVTKRLGERQTLFVGLACNAVGFAIMGLAPIGYISWPAFVFVSIGSMAGPSMLSLITRVTGPGDQGHTIGALASAAEIASLAAPTIFAAIFAAAIGPMARAGLSGAPFLLAGLCLVGALVLGLRIGRTQAPV
jgi:DHA1 family tetracycline resistance protein-like MFS transporter